MTHTLAGRDRRAATRRVRAACRARRLDALLVCGSEYTGFEGAVRYLSRLPHRPPLRLRRCCRSTATRSIVFPTRGALGRRARRGVDRRAGLRRAPRRLDRATSCAAGKRVGVYGLDYVMAVRDYRALAAGRRARRLRRRVRPRARGQVRRTSSSRCARACAINEAGFWAFRAAYEPGKTAGRADGARPRRCSPRAGCGRPTMDMVLGGPGGVADARVPDPRRATPIARRPAALLARDRRARAATGSSSRGRCARHAERRDAARCRRLRRVRRRRADDDARRRDRARRPPRRLEGLPRARLPARPRHRPLDRDDDDRAPADRRGHRHRARARTWSSRCTRTRSPTDGSACLYMQDTWLVTADGGVPLAGLEMKIY